MPPYKFVGDAKIIIGDDSKGSVNMAAVEKQPVTGAGPLNGLLTWVDARFPLIKLWEEQWGKYVAPKNFNFWYYFGSLSAFVLVLQIVTGIFLTMHYKPDASAGVRLGRVHHARRVGRLDHPLHAFDRRLGVFHLRLSAHVPRPAYTARIASRASCCGFSAC